MSIDLSSRRQVGKTSLSLPPFGMGSGPLGGLYEDLKEADAQATLGAAWEGGLRFYDTAPWYGRGMAEHRVGTFLRDKPRADYVLTTKSGRTLLRPKDPASFDRAPWKGGLRFDVKYDYTYDGIMRSYEQALQRLGIPTVDGLAIHDLDKGFLGDAYEGHLKELLDSGFEAMVELKRSGDIKAVGMGFNLSEALDRVVGDLDLDYALVAMPYTLLEQTALHTGMAQCLKRNVSVVIGAPFASGILATGSGAKATYAYTVASPAVQDKVKKIEAVCAAHNVKLPTAALQFPLAHPAVASLIAGGVRPHEVTANIASITTPIPPGFWSDLRSQKLIDPEAPTP